MRVPADDDVSAFDPIQARCKKHGRELAERTLSPVLVEGIVPVVDRLRDIVSLSIASDQPPKQQSPLADAVARASHFVAARRRAIGRIAKISA